jgi:hypothetical protein
MKNQIVVGIMTFSKLLAAIFVSMTLLFYVALPKIDERSLLSKGSRRDNSDSCKDISGLRVTTDHGTGVQYLVTFSGGITPRINGDGQPIVLTGEIEGKECD